MRKVDCIISRKRLKYLVISITILWQASIVPAQLLDVPLSDELYREVYDFIDKMITHQAVVKIFKNTLPYSHAEIAQVLIELDRKVKEWQLKLSQVEQRKLERYLQLFSENSPISHSSSELKSQNTHLFQIKGEKHRFAIDFGIGEDIISRGGEAGKAQTAHTTLFRPTVFGQIRDDFAFYSDLKAYFLGATRFEDFPKTEARTYHAPQKTASAALTAYYMKFKLPWFELFFGKDNLHWGPGRHGALLISEYPLPMNMIKLTARYHPVKFQSVTGILDSNLASKYLSAHRLEFNLWQKLRLGIAETIVYGERFEIVYLNPVQIYTVTEIPSKIVKGEKIRSPDNLLDSVDFDLTLLKNLEFYGELLLDDFKMFSYGLRSYRNWASKFGVLLGCYYVDPFSLTDTEMRIEYAFINQYTYTHRNPINTYTHFDSIIGHKIGTDADDLWLSVRHWFTPNFTMSLGYELERHGEGDVNKPHEGKKDARDDDEWEFLSGVTESTNSLSLGFSYATIGRYFADLKYTVSWIKNVKNKLNENSTRHQFILECSYRF